MSGVKEQGEEEVDSNNSTGNEPRIYGGAEISDEALKVLSKDPSYMILDRIDLEEVRVEIEKALTKARWEWMNSVLFDNEGDEEVNNEDARIEHSGSNDSFETTLNYANLKATDIPTVQRLFPPKPGNLKQEKTLEKLSDKLMKIAEEYKNENCDSKGNFIRNNLNKEENLGIKEIKDKIKQKDIVIFSTDKSGKFSVDTPENYEKALSVHTQKDKEITNDRVRSIETTINHHMRHFNRMFNVGSTHDQEERVMAATLSTHTPPPPLYGLRKDHKQSANMEEGPPVRPVCGANQAPNSRLSNFLSRIVNDYADKANIETECRSGEEMRAAFEEYNNIGLEKRKDYVVLSMDVKALYPSMEWHEIMTAVREMIEQSTEQIENVDWLEVGKYLAVTMEPEQIEREGLRLVIPERKEDTGRKIGVAYLNNKENNDKWKEVRSPGERQKKKMLGLAIAEGIRTCMANHVYCMGDKVYLQSEGGPIGLELTGAVSRPFMARYDRMYLERVKQAGMDMKLYERYVDDSNQICEVPPLGAKYDKDNRKIIIDPIQYE